jgi:SAM-dependent methyltransferase
MHGAMYEALKRLKSGTNDETNGRHIIPAEAVRWSRASANPRILDVGAGRGEDLGQIALDLERVGKSPELFAVECFPLSVEALRRLGASVTGIDIEHDALPFNARHFDIVICNQVLEHTKEIFWIISEIARVLKSGGTLILGVPNLGSLHNRIALLGGYQPPAIAVFGSHVRGFTIPGLKSFLETGGILKVRKVLGGNFYPFPPKISRLLARLLPSFAVSSFYIMERVGEGSFLSVFHTEQALVLVDTPYFRGEKTST